MLKQPCSSGDASVSRRRRRRRLLRTGPDKLSLGTRTAWGVQAVYGSRWPSAVSPHPQVAAAAAEEVPLPPLLQASGLLRLAGTAAPRNKAAAL